MITAETINVCLEGQDLLICCNACKRLIGRIQLSMELADDGRRAEVDQQVRTIRNLHLAKCPGDLG
jgi:hypothetical protein